MNNIKEISPDKDIHTERLNAVSIVVPLSNPKSGNFVMEKFKTTKKGVVSVIYNGQRERSRTYKMPYPVYSYEELIKWCYSQPLFHELYDVWVASGYLRDLKPSVDRIIDSEWYSFDNIQLMTWGENNTKAHNDRKKGINNKCSKAVIQYDLDGNFIKEYYSQNQASRETSIYQGSISSCCRGISKKAGGYVWKYAKD